MSNANKGKPSFVLYNSIIESASYLDDAHFKECLRLIWEYSQQKRSEDEIQSDFWGVNCILKIAKPLMDKARQRYENCVKNGSKGQGNGIDEQDIHQEIPQDGHQETHQSQTLNENVEEKAYEKEDEYLKDYVNLKKENGYLKEKDNGVSGSEITAENKSLNSPPQRTSSSFFDSLHINDDLESDCSSSTCPPNIQEEYEKQLLLTPTNER